MDTNNMQDEITRTVQPDESVIPHTEQPVVPADTPVAGDVPPTAPVEEVAIAVPLSKKEQKKLKRAQKKEEKKQKRISRKVKRKAKRKRWKETKKEDRKKLKEHYKDAPWFIRIPRLMLAPALKVGFWIAVAAIVIGLGYGIYQGVYLLNLLYLDDNRLAYVEPEVIEELSPYDKEGAEYIDSLPGIGEDETWTICIYMIGSNLEDFHENDLSRTTLYETGKKKAERDAAAQQHVFDLLEGYSGDLKKHRLNLPDFLYYPEKPVAYRQNVYSEVIATDEDGAASLDIAEMLYAKAPKNVQIVIQTGGATRWSNNLINPNKTQRFLIKNGSFEEISNMPLQNSTDPATLTEFIRFCNNNYKSDHRMLILWDHGSGPFGYGVDDIYGGDEMQLSQIRTALKNANRPNIDNPPFDIIGFDACLMSNLEVTHALYGFADYYAVSEELEPGDGWDYYSLLEAMNENPTMSPAKVAQTIADTYVDYYMTERANVGHKFATMDVTFSVVDAKKAEELYQAYCELTKQQLIDSATDIGVLAEIGRCCNKSTHVCSDSYNVLNLVDLGNYVDHMVDTYPEESSKIANLLEEAVIYHRENGSLSDAEGMSVYIPGSIDSFSGLYYFLTYEYDICEDDCTRALYFYKMSGCLNDEMLIQLKSYTDARPKVLDIAVFNKFEKTTPVIKDNIVNIPVSSELERMMQSYTFDIATYDENTGEIVYYGEDEYVELDGYGNLVCDFSGAWVYLEGEPLAIEMTSVTESYVEYRSRILYNGTEAYLVFAYDRDTEDFNIKGVRIMQDEDVDGINFLVNTKSNIELKSKDVIIPLYTASDYTGRQYDKQGNSVKYKTGTKISMKALPADYYLAMVDIYDQRGDVYHSPVLGYTVSATGKVKKVEVDKNFIGTDY